LFGLSLPEEACALSTNTWGWCGFAPPRFLIRRMDSLLFSLGLLLILPVADDNLRRSPLPLRINRKPYFVKR
jgi:hypothetical protein